MRRTKQIWLLGLFLPALLFSCKSKPAAELSTNIVLTRGTGAIIVIFPKPSYFTRSDWMAQITLDGPLDTHTLPRMPFADVQSLLMLNIPPATYSGSTVSFVRGSPPSFGGSFDSLSVKAGEITILKAKDISREHYPFEGTLLKPSGTAIWSLKDANQLQAYITELANKAGRPVG